MKEREIDLLDMIADILSHWRGLLIAIVLGAVLLGAFSYTRSYRNMQNMQNMQSQEAENTSEDEMTIEEKLAQLSENLDDSQLTAVLTTVDDAKEYALKKQYVQDSIYMQLDPMNVAQEELIYNIQEKDENGSQRLGTIYRNTLNSVGLYDWIEQQTGLEAAYVGELVSVSVDSGLTLTNGEPLTIGGSDSLKIIIRGVDAESCGKIAEAVKTYMEQQQGNLNTRLGSHELVLLSEVSGNIMNMDVMNQQTAYRNSIYGLETAIAAAKAAYAHSFIRRMSDGYNTVISEDGGNLSQGQKQLLCIARAMLTNPSILILDEATSSIDTLTEIRVQKAFAKMMKGKTSFVVAHRLSTIKESDVILVMKDGNIIEQGTHEELLAKGGFYNKLYNSQFAKQ